MGGPLALVVGVGVCVSVPATRIGDAASDCAECVVAVGVPWRRRRDGVRARVEISVCLLQLGSALQ